MIANACTHINEVIGLGAPSAVGVVQLERPQEVGCLLEVRAYRGNLVHQVLNADQPVFAQGRLDKGVVGETNAVAVYLAVTTLVDQLPDGLEVGLPVINEQRDNIKQNIKQS